MFYKCYIFNNCKQKWVVSPYFQKKRSQMLSKFQKNENSTQNKYHTNQRFRPVAACPSLNYYPLPRYIAMSKNKKSSKKKSSKKKFKKKKFKKNCWTPQNGCVRCNRVPSNFGVTIFRVTRFRQIPLSVLVPSFHSSFLLSIHVPSHLHGQVHGQP